MLCKEWWKSLSVAGRYREERKTLTLKVGNIEVVWLHRLPTFIKINQN